MWNKSLPLGTEDASSGDNRIRELKTDLEGALQAQAPDAESVFPGSDPSAPLYRYRGLKGATGARPPTGEAGLFFDTTRNVLQRDNGTSWDDVGTVIPAGTVMTFFQAAAPTGFTQVVSQNDRVLRVVSGGGGGFGGSHGIATAITLAHAHTIAAHHHSISHTHISPVLAIGGQVAVGNGLTDWPYGTSSVSASTVFAGAGAGAGGSHPALNTSDSNAANSGDASTPMDSQLADVALSYIDVIIASKD